MNFYNYKTWIPLISFLSVGITFLLYGTTVQMAGDQSPQIAAGIAYAEEGELLVAPHYTRVIGTEITIGEDYRHPLFWFPPGYSMMVAFLYSLTGSASLASLILFAINRFISVYLWLVA